ncbi:MAG: hypothetical protein IPG79_17745 [Saprospiraceae bacterium]|nr:hypothetical protein [Saprospiraceae bacterium]
MTINTNPVASITGDDEICEGESTTFTANGGITYNWTSGNNQSITVSTANTYTSNRYRFEQLFRYRKYHFDSKSST